ncbi:hypoxanthine/guanine phosphoribosyltransferase [Methanococcus voltae]|uniref:Hypoxanthine/guanine phosphoribosyltransferase n=1 Tax=Methanococcus voltae (strain ATCC BAA-1334 / A3) TaxID=456320 RepID=HPRT_METV3|nr:hypoxanthine/guanine phosphoribosyltransferase [Methanococcus voltae]D7DQT8.1 RecName: Full=Hypoxanthine/guanine phosphoribosyltransferase; Short=HGPRTase [Methanococcus voltae A3]MCS3900875.1 adenine phosphoribosyltransferase [Methanococcus voltae]
MKKVLDETLESSPIIKRGEYNYFIHPIADGVPLFTSDLLRDVATRTIQRIDTNIDKIVTAEAMGIPIATAISMSTDIPYVVMRKRQYFLEGEVPVHQETGYSKGELYLNGVEKGDRVTIVDDVLSTGGTLIAVIKALEKAGAEIVDIVCVIERGDGKSKVKEITGYDVQTLVKIDVTENGVVILESN